MQICIVYNIPQLYREGIWEKLSEDILDDYFIYCDYIKEHSVKHIDKNKIKFYNKNGSLKIYPILKNIYIKDVLIYQRHLVKLIFKKKFDKYIFLGDSYSLSTWICLIFLKISRKKVIIWTHGSKGGENILKRNFLKCFYSLSDHLLLYGNFSKKILKTKFKLKKEMSVVYNSLNYSKQLKIRNIISDTNHDLNFKYLIFIGRIERRKRIDLLLEAFSLIIKNKQYSSLRLYIIGDGLSLNELKNKYKNPNVIFLGAIYDERIIADYLYNAELLVSPGHVGLNVIHSLTYGTPIITHNNFKNHSPEFEAILPGKTGDFFKENSIEDLSNVIINWLEKYYSRKITRNECYDIIDNYYNPNYQHNIIKTIIHDDL